MSDENLFRMNFIVQNSNAMTFETNLVKIVEAVLYNTASAQSLSQITEQIKEVCDLTFSEDEVRSAITRKGNNIQFSDGYYSLKSAYKGKIAKLEPFDTKMSRLVKQAIDECNLDVTEKYLSNLLINYLYYCFNANKESILSLVNNTSQKDRKLNYKEDDIKLINSFLDWENEEKNKFVYETVSCGYIYCSLTVKKNEMLANKMFRGKVFVLDANIIFRLAGINNNSRMQTMESFVSKCKEVGVTLCYTTETLDELLRVIISSVRWIERVTGGEEPLNLSEYTFEKNDFYQLYYEWASSRGNQHDDFKGFTTYVKNLVYGITDQLKVIESTNYEVKDQNEFEKYVSSLRRYKEDKASHEITDASINTDVNNFLYLKDKRRGETRGNVWMINDFLISADQNLIAWSVEVEKGVPIIVLPSVWLTIMLRFSGRTDNDYKAFCAFLELRTHIPEDSIDVYGLMETLSEKTSDNDLKSRIIQEVFDHRNDYENINNDYSKIADKAYDTLRNEESEALRNEIDYLEGRCKSERKNFEIRAEVEKEDKLNRLVEHDCEKHFYFIDKLNKFKYGLAALVAAVAIFFTVLTILKVGPFYQLFSMWNMDIYGMLGLCWTILIVVAALAGRFISYLASDKRKSAFKNKRRIYYEKV